MTHSPEIFPESYRVLRGVGREHEEISQVQGFVAAWGLCEDHPFQWPERRPPALRKDT